MEGVVADVFLSELLEVGTVEEDMPGCVAFPAMGA